MLCRAASVEWRQPSIHDAMVPTLHRGVLRIEATRPLRVGRWELQRLTLRAGENATAATVFDLHKEQVAERLAA